MTRHLNFKFDLGRVVARRNRPILLKKFFSHNIPPGVLLSVFYTKKYPSGSLRFFYGAHTRAYCTLPKNAEQTINMQAWANSQKMIMMKPSTSNRYIIHNIQ